jgi:hypothetical protein
VVGVYGTMGGAIHSSVDMVEAFREEHDLEMPLRKDEQRSMYRLNWPETSSPFPRQVVVGPTGQIVYIETNFDLEELLGVIESLLP